MNQFESEYRRNSSSFRRKNSADMVEEITLEKISNLEDEYSNMKKALLSSMESDDEYINSDEEGFANAKESTNVDVENVFNCQSENVFGAPKSTTNPSNINSRSFLDESSSRHKNFSKTHGKLSTVDEFVDTELKLGNYSPIGVDLKHEAVLDRAIGKGGNHESKVNTIPEDEDKSAASVGVAHSSKGRLGWGVFAWPYFVIRSLNRLGITQHLLLITWEWKYVIVYILSHFSVTITLFTFNFFSRHISMNFSYTFMVGRD